MRDQVKKRAIIDLIPLLINTEDCILYTKSVSSDGYGQIQYTYKNHKFHFRAHRIAYEIANNVTLNTSNIVCHKCDTPNCINPKHLFIGTHKDNVDDKVSKGRQAKGKNNGRYTHGFYSRFEPVENPKLIHNHNRKLSLEFARELKLVILNRGTKPLTEIAKEYNISYCTLRDLSCGRVYKVA